MQKQKLAEFNQDKAFLLTYWEFAWGRGMVVFLHAGSQNLGFMETAFPQVPFG